jgi:hypothetical protein
MLHHERSETDLSQPVFTRSLTLPAKQVTDEQAGHGTEGIGTTS